LHAFVDTNALAVDWNRNRDCTGSTEGLKRARIPRVFHPDLVFRVQEKSGNEIKPLLSTGGNNYLLWGAPYPT
jgi:hypothetical protein